MNKFALTPIQDLLKKPIHSNWLIENFLEKQSLNMLFGQPGSCKSFLAMEIAFCVSLGIDWYGNTTIKGDVLYIAGEGSSGIQKRFLALEEKYNRSSSGIFVSDVPAQITDTNAVSTILREIKKATAIPKLIIIDTMHRNFGDGDENSSRDVGLFIKHLDKLKSAVNTTILVIHHSGHGDKGHSRGSSAIRASLDAEYQLKTEAKGVTLNCTKMKDSDKPESLFYVFNPVTITTPIGTAESGFLTKSVKHTKKTRTEVIFEELENTLSRHGQAIPSNLLKLAPNLKGKKCITSQEWQCAVTSRLSQDMRKGSIQPTFRRSKTELLNSKKITELESYIAGDCKIFCVSGCSS